MRTRTKTLSDNFERSKEQPTSLVETMLLRSIGVIEVMVMLDRNNILSCMDQATRQSCSLFP